MKKQHGYLLLPLVVLLGCEKPPTPTETNYNGFSITIESKIIEGAVQKGNFPGKRIDGLCFLTEQIGFAYGGNSINDYGQNVLFVTEDHMKTWRECSIPDKLLINGLKVLNGSFVYALTQPNLSPFDSLYFSRSDDYGRTWESTPLSPYATEDERFYLKEVKMLNAQIGYIVGTWQYDIYSAYAVSGIVYKTQDGGHSWQLIHTTPKNKSIQFSSINFLDAGKVVVTGLSYDSVANITQAAYFESFDNGSTWKENRSSILYPGTLIVNDTKELDGSFLATVRGFTNASFYSSTDNGTTWKMGGYFTTHGGFVYHSKAAGLVCFGDSSAFYAKENFRKLYRIAIPVNGRNSFWMFDNKHFVVANQQNGLIYDCELNEVP